MARMERERHHEGVLLGYPNKRGRDNEGRRPFDTNINKEKGREAPAERERGTSTTTSSSLNQDHNRGIKRKREDEMKFLIKEN